MHAHDIKWKENRNVAEKPKIEKDNGSRSNNRVCFNSNRLNGIVQKEISVFAHFIRANEYIWAEYMYAPITKPQRAMSINTGYKISILCNQEAM